MRKKIIWDEIFLRLLSILWIQNLLWKQENVERKHCTGEPTTEMLIYAHA